MTLLIFSSKVQLSRYWRKTFNLNQGRYSVETSLGVDIVRVIDILYYGVEYGRRSSSDVIRLFDREKAAVEIGYLTKI